MSLLLGLGTCLGASLMFGSVFVPIKSLPPGDGFAAQLFLCMGGLFVSLLVSAFQGFPAIQPAAMIGGALWCAANCSAIPIMNRLGMAMGVLIWNTFSCLTGWATSRFGLLGLPAAIPQSVWLNYAGIVILIVGSMAYLLVESNPAGSKQTSNHSDDIEGSKGYYCPSTGEEIVTVPSNEKITILERITCLVGAVVAGCCYGSMVTPITYVQSHPEQFPDAPPTTLPYLFSFFTGTMAMSLLIFVGYCLIKRNRPSIDPQLVLPSICSGLIFGTAMAFFLLANQLLSQTIAYPVCSMAPGLVVSLWSVLYFREITGRRNIIILAVAYGFTLVGVTCVTISRDVAI